MHAALRWIDQRFGCTTSSMDIHDKLKASGLLEYSI